MYKIALDNLATLFSLINENKELYAPIKIGEQVNFAAWDKNSEVDLNTLKTVKSAKDAFFPQSETLYTCKTEDNKITFTPQELQNQQFVVFGVKPCDVRGFEVLDRVFLSDPVDTFYAARRFNGVVVSLACNEPDDSCFCSVFGIDASNPVADVATWIVNGELYWNALSDKGIALTEQVKSVLVDADEAVVEAKKAEIKDITAKLPYTNLSLEGWNGDALEEKFNATNWEELYKTCLACGTCTFVCPTCQCYDIKDYKGNQKVERYRCWDSCMYSDFTMMAHGNNRNSQMQRFRQRFMHKLVYFPANNDGMYSCVGCGRCVDKCPASLNIVKVIKSFQNKGGNV